MPAQIISGKALSESLYQALALRVAALRERGVTPGLTVILVGDDPGSQVYVRNKGRACEKIGVASRIIRLPADTTQNALLALVADINADPAVHGLLVQLPLPRHIDEKAVIRAIDPAKDVDAFHPENTGALLSGLPGMLPCTPSGILHLLHSANVCLDGANAVMLGRSNIVGKPTALLLLRENATVTVCHSKTRDLPSVLARADVLVVAIGKPRFVTREMVKPGAVVIDVGMNRLPDGKLCGDVDFDGVSAVAGAITPVPGGVGLMTVAMLMRNTVEAAEKTLR